MTTCFRNKILALIGSDLDNVLFELVKLLGYSDFHFVSTMKKRSEGASSAFGSDDTQRPPAEFRFKLSYPVKTKTQRTDFTL